MRAKTTAVLIMLGIIVGMVIGHYATPPETVVRVVPSLRLVTVVPTVTPTPTPTPTVTPTPTPSIDEDELKLLAEVMYHENWSNGDEAMLLTGSVVLNRVKSSDYPDTIEGVIYQKGQYATTKVLYSVNIPDRVYKLAEQLLTDGSVAPDNVVYQAMFTQGSGVYKQVGTDYFCYK